LYFTLDKANDVNYQEEKWHMEEENRGRMESELAELAREAEEFDKLLNSVDTEEVETAVETTEEIKEAV